MNDTCNIIIADDHQIIVDGIKSILQGTPYHITAHAANGQQAIDIMASHPDSYDILIADISMPLLSGIELCKWVKARYPNIKVLILSMYSSMAMIKEALLAEADGFLLKNAGKEKLLEALYRIKNHSTYYSDEIIPIIYSQIEKEKQQNAQMAVLSEREKEILTLIVREFTSGQIAEKLFISKKTVDNHRARILEKTGCRSTVGLVKFALKNGIE
jgi:DNA-binding NarL/FixJ family response regulator